MLSSFINRRKVKKISLFDAALRRTPSSTPLEDQENPRSRQHTLQSKDHVSVVTTLRSSVLHRQSSPKVHLDFIPSRSSDWFPQDILAPFDEDGHLPLQPVPQSCPSSGYDDVVVIGPTAVSSLRSFPASRSPRPVKASSKAKPQSGLTSATGSRRPFSDRVGTGCMLPFVSH